MAAAHPSREAEALFQAACEQPPDARAAFLDEACDDPTLRAEVETLLAADAKADERGFLDAPVVPERATHDLTGQTVGPYTIERPLGSGGMGDVYLAVREQPFHQTVALKVLRQSIRRGEIRQRFTVERQILATLDHDGIARLHDGGLTNDGQPYFAMELVEGQPLTVYCDERRLGIDERLRLFMSVCSAVHYAHQNLVVHRDLKPSNIFVVDRGDGVPSVKLLDFGVAKLLSPEALPIEPVETRTLDRVLTPQYAAPEQIRGGPITTATDVYALGVVLYELLTGRRPYHLANYSVAELEHVICEAPVEPPSTRVGRDKTAGQSGDTTRTGSAAEASAARDATTEQLQRTLRGDLDSIVLKALRKEPQARYASTEQFAADLERYLEGQPVTARRGSRRYRAKKYVQRHRVGIAAAALVLVALVGGLSAALWQARAAEAARAETQHALDNTEVALGRAEAVTEFLQSLFEANDYMSPTGGDTLNSIELLELGIERAHDLTDEPEVQAQVLQTIGLTYFAVDELERADSLLRQALAIRRATLGSDHPDVAETLGELGWRLVFTGDYDEAEALLLEATDIQRRTLPDPHYHTAETLHSLGTVYRIKAEYEKAKPVLREALAMTRRLPDGEERRALLPAMLSELGMVHRLQGELDESEVLLREALAAMRSLYGNRHVETGAQMSNLAGLLLRMDQLEEAEALQRDALSISREQLGDEHHIVAIDLGVLAQIHARRGDLNQAETLYLDSIQRHYRALGEGHPRAAPLLLNLSKVYQDQEAYPEAEQALRESLAIVCTAFGSAHAHTGRVQQALADLYTAWGQPATSTECVETGA